MKRRFIMIIVFTLLYSILLNGLSFASAQNNNLVEDTSYSIQGTEMIKEVLRFSHGDGENQVGFKESKIEDLHSITGVTSFAVKENIFYLLDNVNKKIMISDGINFTNVYLHDENWLEDFDVTDEGEFYILSGHEVLKLSKNGKLQNKFTVPDSITVPTEIEVNSKGGIIVHQAQDSSFIIEEGKQIKATTFFEEQKVNVTVSDDYDVNGKLQVLDNSRIEEIPFKYNYSSGGTIVNDINNDQIVVTKTEIAPNIPAILTETHVEVWDRQGNVLGGVRIPLEKMVLPINHWIQVDNGHIYLLSIEEDYTVIYELFPGYSYSSILEERINKIDTISCDEQTNIQPQGNGGRNRWIHRSDALSRANSMINLRWTVNQGNKTRISGTVLPDYVNSASTNTTLTGIPYKWGGCDGHDTGAGSRESFSYYQTQGRQAGNTAKLVHSDVTGVDCSGFVQLAWNRIDKKYGTSTLGDISSRITKASLKYMDALNKSGSHVVLYNSQSGTTVLTKEATVDGAGHKAKNYSRTWTSLDSGGYVPIRYTNIVDDHIWPE